VISSGAGASEELELPPPLQPPRTRLRTRHVAQNRFLDFTTILLFTQKQKRKNRVSFRLFVLHQSIPGRKHKNPSSIIEDGSDRHGRYSTGNPPVLRQPGCPPRLLRRTRGFAPPGCPGFALIGTDSSVYDKEENPSRKNNVLFQFNMQMRRGSSEPSGYSCDIAKLRDIPSIKKTLFKSGIQKCGLEIHPRRLFVAFRRRMVYVFNEFTEFCTLIFIRFFPMLANLKVQKF
jgi:hypothetical protein